MLNQSLDHEKINTIERHILDEQRSHPEATGVLTSLLYDIALAGKVIVSQTSRGGLVEILGKTGSTNIQGEEVMKLDELADRMIYRQELLYLLDSRGLRVAVTDANGLFQNGYDLGSLAGIKENERDGTDIGGFSVDSEGNMLFTIPVKFAAFVFFPDGEIIRFGKPGGAPGKFNNIGGIVADDRGYYYVADKLKSAILVFDKDLQFQLEFGYRGFRPENLNSPKELALDSEGRLYVSQLGNRGISVFQITYK